MKKILFCTAVLLTSACCWQSPDSTFYVMESQGLESVSNRRLNISVATVNVPDMLDCQQMITYTPNNRQIHISEFNRWGEALPYILQNTITNDLMAYLPQAYVKSARYDTEMLTYNVKVEVNKFEAIPNQKARLLVWWNITNSQGTVIKRQQAAYEAPVNADTIPALVDAQNETVHLLSKDIAETLSRL